MQIAKTHIFLKENKWTGMGGQPIECITVHECKVLGANLAAATKHYYFMEEKNQMGINLGMKMISEAEFEKLNADTELVIKSLEVPK